MIGMGPIHWITSATAVIALLIKGLVFVIPAAIVLRRMGIRRRWAVLAIHPLTLALGLWILALTRWEATADATTEPDAQPSSGS